MQFLSNAQFHQMFTMHGTVMLLFFGTPVVIGFGNYIVPLHIGAPDVAFPQLNALGYWLFASEQCFFSPASSPPAERQPLAGRFTHHCRIVPIRHRSAQTCGSWAYP